MSSGVSVYPGTIPGSWGTRMSWVVSVNRQVAGVGFQKDPDLTSEGMTSAEEQALTRISREFNQLSVGMAAQPEALYSTTFVFDDKTGRWGIVVVGSGGEYGETGAIQTALAPDGMPLAEVASRMLGVLSDNLLLSPSALNDDGSDRPIARASTSGVDPGALAQSLATVLSMSREHRYTLLDVPKAKDEWALTALISTVPEPLARLARWSTAYPVDARNWDNRVITCLWPDDLIQRHPSDHESAMSISRLTAPSVLANKVPRSLAWYAQMVCRGNAEAVRQKAEMKYVAQLDGIGPGISQWEQWERGSATWAVILEELRPLADDELDNVLSLDTFSSVLGRWDDDATRRLLQQQPECLRRLLTHPRGKVRASAWRIAVKETPLYSDLVAWQIETVRMGQPAPQEAADPTWREALARNVLTTATRGTTDSEWGPRAERWLRSLHLDPRNYEGLLPLWQEKVIERFEHDPTRIEDLLVYVQSAHDGTETLIKAARRVPRSLRFLLLRLWREPVTRVTWKTLLDDTLPLKAEPARVVKVLRLLNDTVSLSEKLGPSTGAVQSRPQEGVYHDIASKGSIPIELRQEIIAHLSARLSPTTWEEAASSLLNFEYAMPLPPTRPASDTSVMINKPSTSLKVPQSEKLKGGPARPPEGPSRRPARKQILRPPYPKEHKHNLTLRVSLIVNVLLSIVLFFIIVM